MFDTIFTGACFPVFLSHMTWYWIAAENYAVDWWNVYEIPISNQPVHPVVTTTTFDLMDDLGLVLSMETLARCVAVGDGCHGNRVGIVEIGVIKLEMMRTDISFIQKETFCKLDVLGIS